MKIETYLQNRLLFESRYHLHKNELENSPIELMLKGIYNKNLFFELYAGFDKKVLITLGVSSIDKYKRYKCRKGIASKIKLINSSSMFDKYEGMFERVVKHLKTID